VTAADDPVKLGREPPGTTLDPGGRDPTADGDDVRRGIVRKKALKPVRVGNRVIVEEGDDLARREREAGIA